MPHNSISYWVLIGNYFPGRRVRRPHRSDTEQLAIRRGLSGRKLPLDILLHRHHPERMPLPPVHPEDAEVLRVQDDRHLDRQRQRKGQLKREPGRHGGGVP